jgi:hypothetical protein
MKQFIHILSTYNILRNFVALDVNVISAFIRRPKVRLNLEEGGSQQSKVLL